METYQNNHIQEIPLSSPFFRAKVERFLAANGLRLEESDAYYTLQNEQNDILAGAGLKGDVIQCVAVASEARSEGLLAPLLSHVLAMASAQGITCLKLFTKPGNQAVFESLGFHLLASAPQAILMENGRELERYCAGLRACERKGRCGVVVMHANPFTLGHRYLLEQAARQVDTLFVIPVREDRSVFPYRERLAMIRSGAPEGVQVLEGSAYQISAATFPTYFLKDLSAASATQMQLDLDLFVRHIAPALGVSVRFVGTEAGDPLTAAYNAQMREQLPAAGIAVVEVPRCCKDGEAVSASAVRRALAEGRFSRAAALTPASSHPYLLAALAQRALQLEVDTPMKPGLVGPDGNGAHPDMNYALMCRSIQALRPYWSALAMTRTAEALRQAGLEAESAMLSATGGVNTHRGAVFCLGLLLHVAGRFEQALADKKAMRQALSQVAESLVAEMPTEEKAPLSHGRAVVQAHAVKGAREMALDGYAPLFETWQPCYAATKGEPLALQRILLGLIATLDDTCMIYRVGLKRARQLREQAAEAARDLDEGTLRTICESYAAEGVSPGGAADMLAMTILTDSLIN